MSGVKLLSRYFLDHRGDPRQSPQFRSKAMFARTLPQSLKCVRLTLWDEGRQRLVSFREMRQRQPAA